MVIAWSGLQISCPEAFVHAQLPGNTQGTGKYLQKGQVKGQEAYVRTRLHWMKKELEKVVLEGTSV